MPRTFPRLPCGLILPLLAHCLLLAATLLVFGILPSSRHRDIALLPSSIVLAPEVQHAIAHGLPVVALESTIITHGMPYPENLLTANGVETIVREGGAVPATIAVLNGTVFVGLLPAQIEFLASAPPGVVSKASWRDLSAVIAKRGCASTTVAATAVVARKVGISVFVTGGIGGVHRMGESTMDISADLHALSRIPGLAVVSAGAKSLLDLSRTLEVLETLGVTVVGYGTDEFPAFYSPSSGLPVPVAISLFNNERRLFYLVRSGNLHYSIPQPRMAAKCFF